MNLRRLMVIALVSLLFSSSESWAERLQVGAPAPPIFAETMRNAEFDLAAHEGEVVLLQFWASWCGGCLAEMPNVARLHDEFGDNGLRIVAISLDTELKEARRAVSQNRMVWTQIVDGLGKESPIATAYGVRGTPYFVLIGRDGRILAPVVKPSELTESVRSALASQ